MRQRQPLSSEKAAHRVHRAWLDHFCASCVCLLASVAAIVPIFKILHAKSRDFRPQNRTISVPTVRATFNLRAQNQPESFRRHSTPPCTLRQASAAAARVFCAKTAPKFIETFAISTENHEFRPQILRQKTLLSSGKAPRPVQRALKGRLYLA